MKKLYITDLDGTLLDSNAVLSSRSKAIINKVLADGAAFTVATARTFATVLKLFEGVELKLPLVLMNGVMLFDPVKRSIINCHSINPESLEKILSVYRKHRIFPLVYRIKDNLLEIEYYSTDNPYQMKYVGKRVEADGKRFVFSDSFTAENKSEAIYIVTLDKYDRILPLYEDIKKIDDISCVFYSDNYTDCYFLEIFASGVSKASSMAEVKKIIGAESVVAFGDNLNDMEMFRMADESYAVENACSELKKIATGVIGTNDDSSVAEYILKDYTVSSDE